MQPLGSCGISVPAWAACDVTPHAGLQAERTLHPAAPAAGVQCDVWRPHLLLPSRVAVAWRAAWARKHWSWLRTCCCGFTACCGFALMIASLMPAPGSQWNSNISAVGCGSHSCKSGSLSNRAQVPTCLDRQWTGRRHVCRPPEPASRGTRAEDMLSCPRNHLRGVAARKAGDQAPDRATPTQRLPLELPDPKGWRPSKHAYAARALSPHAATWTRQALSGTSSQLASPRP